MSDMTQIGLVVFQRPLGSLTPKQREDVATVLGELSTEIGKGHHLNCGTHVIRVSK